VSIALHQPSLDDVFLSITGHRATQEPEAEEEMAEPGAGGRRGRRGQPQGGAA
jgi:hypothetical protein